MRAGRARGAAFARIRLDTRAGTAIANLYGRQHTNTFAGARRERAASFENLQNFEGVKLDD
jgi:hypothetical protein